MTNRATVRVDPGKKTGDIHPWLYGHFLEHILNSVELGIHAELLTERSFELEAIPARETLASAGSARCVEPESGDWREADGRVLQVSRGAGSIAWAARLAETGDFQVGVRAMKLGGTGGPAIVLETGDGRRVWWCLTGFAGSTRVEIRDKTSTSVHILATGHGIVARTGRMDQVLVTGRWLDLQVKVGDRRAKFLVDGTVRHELDLPAMELVRVGLACVDSQAAFADFRLIGSSGAELATLHPSDAPTGAALLPALGWDPLEGVVTGTCRFSIRHEAPFNSRANLRAEVAAVAESPVGICQGPLALSPCKRLNGSVYLQSPAPGAAVEAGVRSRATGGVLASALLDNLQPAWTRHEFVLTPGAACGDGEFFLRFTAPGVYEIDQVSLIPADAGWPPLRPDLVEAVRALRPAIIRWPGGCFAWVYDWKLAIGPVEKRTSIPLFDWTGNGGSDNNNFGTDEFVAFCRIVGAEPLLVINMNLGVQDALDWIEYCNGGPDTRWGAVRAANGHPDPYGVHCWSIDNERWGYGEEDYARESARFIEAIRARHPGLRIWIVGSSLEPNHAFGPQVENRFGADVARRIPGQADYVSLHGYWGGCEWPRLSVANLRIEEFIRREIASYRGNPGGGREKVALDEWNPGTVDYQSGIGAALIFNTMERQCDAVGMAAPALWIRHVRNGDAWDNALINHDHRGWFPSVTYLVNRAWSQNRCPDLVHSETESPTVHADGMEVPALDAVATADPAQGRLVVKMVNRDPARGLAVTIEAGGAAFDDEAAVTLLAHDRMDDRNTIGEPRRIAPREFRIPVVAGRATLELPPVSAALAVFRK